MHFPLISGDHLTFLNFHLFNFLLVLKNCALSVREMLESTVEELKDKGYTDANDANAQGSRATDGKLET